MSRCRDRFCGADDCDNCHPREEYDDTRADRLYEERREREVLEKREKETEAPNGGRIGP